MNKFAKRVSCAAMAGALALGAMTGCGSKAAGIDGTQTAVTVNEDKITLGEVSFYAHFNAASTYSFYYAYFGMTNLFDQVMDEESGQTYGEYLVTSSAEELGDMMVLKQHAEEYGVAIDDEARAAIEAAAQAYIDKNDEETRNKIAASKEDVIALMELQTYRTLMRDAMARDVDTQVSDEESQQSGVKYVSFSLASEEAEDAEAAEAEEEAAEDAESEDAAAEETPSAAEQNAETTAKAEALLESIQLLGEGLNADTFETAVKGTDDTYSVQSGTFTKADPTDTTLNAAIVEAVSGLTEGSLVPEVVTNEEGTNLYIVFYDKEVDEDATAAKVEEILKERKEENFDTLLAGWKEAAEINVNAEPLAQIVISDASPVTFKQDETAQTAEEGEAAEETAEEGEAAEETAEEGEAAEETVEEGEAAEEAAAEGEAAEAK